jgi:hypothetical protein
LNIEYRGQVKYNDDRLLEAKLKISSVTEIAIQAAESVSTKLNQQLALYLDTSNEFARYEHMVRRRAQLRWDYHVQH